uniref:Receptor ligand binding region domain-containing protein n=1 Tax=Glossina brevipalpis TaxID=37001 RepID=A0A1A9WEU3_9MUSC
MNPKNVFNQAETDMTCDGVLTFWIYFFFILSVSLNEFRLINAGRPNELHIGGIFPIAGKGGWQGGQACMPAARLALDDVNKETNLLPGFRLILHSNDSERLKLEASVSNSQREEEGQQQQCLAILCDLH